ncbi:P-loop containing nucleoside triphosphate hydrolase protein [Lactifluus volemus]|nr:P-loop containing nucleoside triphosphate hydrolase protein [Lactifluus volemus]
MFYPLKRLPRYRHNHFLGLACAPWYFPCESSYHDNPNNAKPVLRALDWTVREGESWAVVGSGAGEKTALLETLLGNMRISPPPPGGPLPSLALKSRPINEAICFVSFAHRPRASGGAFYDYTARYVAVRDEDRITLRQSMFPKESGLAQESKMSSLVDNSSKNPASQTEERAQRFEELTEKLELVHLLDLPFVALTGLDFKTRPTLLSLLHSVHASNNPRIIMGLRLQDPIPEWITHIALVQGGRVKTGERTTILKELASHTRSVASMEAPDSRAEAKVLVDMKNVNVRYHERHILKDIKWTIRAGDRWHLQGTNAQLDPGSGKTTLLSVLTGDHPQSYTQRSPTSALTLFGAARRMHETTHLRARIGVVSPELYNAWPRARNMSVWEAIATGFDGGFVPLGPRGLGVGLHGELSEPERAWRANRIWAILHGLGPHTWGGEESAEMFAQRPFASLPAGVQSMVLLMRALVGRPPVVLLDEVWAGMDDEMIRSARAFLRSDEGVSDEQAVVVISHWEDEVPWGVEDGVKRFKLEGGVGAMM